MKFELTNDQRLYFGLEPLMPHWDRVPLKGDSYRQESILYFDGDIIKRYITSTDEQYKENQYDELTRNRNVLLPKTTKGKEKKLSASVLESRQPTGVYCIVENYGRIRIGSYTSQTTFFENWWEHRLGLNRKPIGAWVSEFIETVPPNYIKNVNAFKKAKKKNIRLKPGDFFAFKIDRSEYGFGRVLLDIDDLKKRKLISKDHGLGFIMGKPVLIIIYAYTSDKAHINIDELKNATPLPSDYMMDNLLFYGEYEIIGDKKLTADQLDFPMSYGRHISSNKYCVFLQWGLIHRELSRTTFDKYLTGDNPFLKDDSPSKKVESPYGYYSVGFRPQCDPIDIKDTIANNGVYDFCKNPKFKCNFDLRNPLNKEIRNEIMEAFGLDPERSYADNCELTKTINVDRLLKTI